MRMSLSSKSGRFPPQFIPSFLALDTTDDVSVGAASPQLDEIVNLPATSPGRRLQVDARLELTKLEQDKYSFILHSRMNSKILSGLLTLPVLTQASEQELRAESKKLLQRCMREDSFRLQSEQNGFRWALVSESDVVLGHSEKVSDEALARATLRLITGQAARALRTFDL